MNNGTTIPPELWAASTRLERHEIDCVVTVMLKILDGKCKMVSAEKHIMEQLYDALKERTGERLPATMHKLIALARRDPHPILLERVYEQRVLAETMISRPVMKGFKSRLRREGVLPTRPETTAEDDAA